MIVRIPTDGPVFRVSFELFASDEVPDAGEPVRQHGEHRHEERQDDETVLRVPVELLEQPCETQETSYLEQMDERPLSTGEGT